MAEFQQTNTQTFDIDRDRRDIDVSQDIARLVPDEQKFVVILMRARKRTTRTAEYIWYDSSPGGYWTQIDNTAGYNTSATELAVEDASLFAPHDLVKVARTGEIMRVTAVNLSTNVLTVARAVTRHNTTGTAAAAILDEDWLVRLGNAMQENSTAPVSKMKQPVKKRGYTQIVRTPFDASMTNEAEELETSESERTRLRRDKALDHRLDLERIAIFGEFNEDDSDRRRYAPGIDQSITENVRDLNGATLTEAEFESWCQDLFTYGSGNKLLVCSPLVLTRINQFATGKLQTEVSSRTYGLRLTRYESAHGDLFLTKSQTLEKEYNNWAFGLDMRNIWYRPLRGRDTTLRTNIQENDRDGWKDEYMTEFGMQVRLDKTHGKLIGVA